MVILVLGTLCALLCVLCALPILIHAFRRSVGTGMMVLLIPCFIVFYAFAQFEHRRKGLLVAGWLSLFVLASVLNAIGTQAAIRYGNAQDPLFRAPFTDPVQ